MAPDSSQLAALDELQSRLTETTLTLPHAWSVCLESSFPPLAFGSRRVCLALSDTVVAKVAWRSEGLVDNQVEALLWEKSDSAVRALLAPGIQLTPGGVFLQTRVLPIAVEAAPDGMQQVRELARAGIVDAAGNLGLWQDKIVCYDYAMLRPELAETIFRVPPFLRLQQP